MELAYPWIGIIGIMLVVVLAIIPLRKKNSYKEGKKVANTELVEQTELYKKLKRRYTIINVLSVVCLLTGMVIAFILASRPVKVSQVNSELRNRDIFLCMDITTSVDELNLKVCSKLKEIVRKLDGERFGITIFNAQAVLLVPLTTDYEYVEATLDKLEEAIEYSIFTETYGDDANNGKYDPSLFNYKYEGTYGYGVSSLIGDGLASCLYNFPDLKENSERTRLIVFVTDNDLNGTPYVSLTEASELCKKNNVKVYGIVPDIVENEEEFKSAIEHTGGTYYRGTSDKMVNNLVEDIEKTNKSKLEKIDIVINDKPQILFGVMVTFLLMYFVLSRIAKRYGAKI